MKKSLLLMAVAFATVAANAQSTWLSGVEASKADEATATYNTDAAKAGVAEANYVVKPVEIGAGLTISNANADAKFGLNGKYVPYFQPTITEGEGKTFEDADKTAYLAFYEETDEAGTLEYTQLSSIEFKASRIGTDAVRMYVELQTLEANGDIKQTWKLVTAENAASVLTNGVYTTQFEKADSEDPTKTVIGGFDGMQPARNKDGVFFKDGTEGGDGTEQTADMWYTQVKCPIPSDFPSDAWNAKLVVYIYGIHNNKQGVICDVKFNHGGSTGIATVKTVNNAANAVVYNLAGQKVGADFKGIVVKNGVKMIQK